MRLSWELRPREELEEDEVVAMRELLARHFLGVEPASFRQDLAEKDRVILLRDEEGRLRGFSTLQTRVEQVAGEPVAVLFSGDTVVDREAWGSPALPQAWLQAALEARERHAGMPMYWLLIAAGFRTYRFLPLFFSEFWPRYDQDPPPALAELMEALAKGRFGSRYQGGVVRLDSPTPVRPEIGAVPEHRLQNPHIAWFVQANPGHLQGDELVCLARVEPENFTPAARRILRAIGRTGD